MKGVTISHRALLFVQKNKCWICGRFMKANNPARGSGAATYTRRTRDHIIPAATLRKRGVPVGVPNNMLFACGYCNSSRGNDELDARQQRKARHLHLAAIAYLLSRTHERVVNLLDRTIERLK